MESSVAAQVVATPPGMPAWRSRWRARLAPALAAGARPWLIALALFVASVAAIAPWGNYPLNDDWQYARAARVLAETGHIEIDTPIAPALIGQLVLAWPFVALFGFSHVLLRLLTMAMACLLVYAVDVLLRLADIPRRLRVAALAAVVLNPLFMDLALSFMTECHGYALALLGALLWLRGRRAADRRASRAAVGFVSAALAAVAIGASFWIRQFAIVAFPALVLATTLELVGTRQWRRLLFSLAPFAVATIAAVATAGGYWLWAKHYHQLKEQFAGPANQLLHFNLVDYQLVTGLQMVYLGGSLAPLLLAWPLRRQHALRALSACAIALAFGLGAYSLIQLSTGDDASSVNLHRLFPFASNVINSEGIGPVTLTDIFFFNDEHFAVLSRDFWQTVTYALVALTALWGLPMIALRGLWRMPTSRRELFLFATALAAFSLVAFVQAMGRNSFDRYYFGGLLGVALAVTALLANDEERFARRRWRLRGTVAYLASATVLGYFTIAGTHDYFRWNDARWRLIEQATAAGIPTTSIDAGYEANGWLSFDAIHGRRPIDDSRCIGGCRCFVPWELGWLWNCHDDSYRIGMRLRDGYVELARDQTHAWLGKDRTLILSRRPRPARP